MSADNYLVIDHDGKQYLIRQGFASDDKPVAELNVSSVAATAEEVDGIIDNWGIIEYGVSWTEAARLANAYEIVYKVGFDKGTMGAYEERLMDAKKTLLDLAHNELYAEREAHLRSKAEGVELAISYLQEIKRAL